MINVFVGLIGADGYELTDAKYRRLSVTFAENDDGSYTATDTITFGGYFKDTIVRCGFLTDSLDRYSEITIFEFKANKPVFVPAGLFRQFPKGFFTMHREFLSRWIYD